MTDSFDTASAHSVFIIERENLVPSWISDVLDEHGLQLQRFDTLAGLLRAVRILRPRAVVIDVASPAATVEPNERTGYDHMVRVLRGAYPGLCIVVLAASMDRQTDGLVREFNLPLALKSFGADKLLSVLSGCGVLLESSSQARRTSVHERPPAAGTGPSQHEVIR